MSEFARLKAFVLWFISEPKQELGASAPWTVKLAGNVIDSPTWCGAATTSLCKGRGDPHPSWRRYLVENGSRLTGELGVNLSGLAFVTSQEVPETDLVANK